jgi:hypothetical protein
MNRYEHYYKMSKIVKRKKKRKIVKRFSQSFDTHHKGFEYRQIGNMYIFPDFPTKDSLYFTVRAEPGFSYTKTCKYGKKIRIPKWLTDGLKRRGLTQELETIEQIRKYVKEQTNGGPQTALRKTKSEVRNPLSSSEKTRNRSKSLSQDQKRSKDEAEQCAGERNHNTV